MLKLIEPTDTDRELLSRLVQLYIYDFTDFIELNDWKIGADGLYPTPDGSVEMWTDPDRYPRLFMVDSEPAGFGLVRQLSAGNFDMEQFFVMRKFRRSGIGKTAAHMLFREFFGNWTVRQISANLPAQAFWRSVVSDYTNGDFQEVEGEELKQTFTS